jgi:hypothetical protein
MGSDGAGANLDPERFRLPPEMRGDLTSVPARPRAGTTFIRGPIPGAWLTAAARSGDAGFRVAVGVWYLTRRYGRPALKSVPEMAAVLGTSTRTVERGFQAVRGRLVEASDTGRKSLWTVRQAPGDRADARSLRGPVPWAWWAAASRLPNPSLRVGAACWVVAGRERSAEFVMSSGPWVEWGLSRFAVARGLASLARAGLVSVTRRAGLPPVVKLREPGDNRAGKRSEA